MVMLGRNGLIMHSFLIFFFIRMIMFITNTEFGVIQFVKFLDYSW